MGNAFELAFNTLLLLTLVAVFFLASDAPIRKLHPNVYLGGMFLLNVLVAVAVLVWDQKLKEFSAIATFNFGGFFLGLLFAVLGAYLLVVTHRDKEPIAVPAIMIGTGITIAIISFLS